MFIAKLYHLTDNVKSRRPAANKRKHGAPSFDMDYSRRSIVFAADLVCSASHAEKITRLIAWLSPHQLRLPRTKHRGKL
jgi:hypothetical protein